MDNVPKFSLIVCTYMRAQPLLNLLNSVNSQTTYPDEILIIDGSTDELTRQLFEADDFKNLQYFKVGKQDRGLTRQRNFGIQKVMESSEIVCFLDDDTVLESDYFENILKVFYENEQAVGVGGVAVNENRWKKNTNNGISNAKYYTLDGYYIKESSRNYLRNILGLNSDALPSVMPAFSHGRTSSYPLNGKAYPVDLIVGMSMNFRKSIFDKIQFSTYFEGYGLYEDADFSLRALRYGKNYITTSAKLHHFHNVAGRPNKFQYGRMVIRNGWYVWRVKYPNPSLKARLKWNAIAFLLTIIRFSNAITGGAKKEAFTESLGRTVGWWSLLYNKPKVEN